MEILLVDGWYIDGDFAIEKIKFEQLFGDSYQYDNLITHEKCTPAWKDIFDEWKRKGLLD